MFGDADLTHLQGITTLKTLSLHFGTRISDEGLLQLATLENLESLKLYSDKLTDAGLAHLATLKNLKSLSLEVPQTRLRLPARVPGAVPRLPMRPAPALTDAGLVHLAPLDKLEVLEIRSGSFSDEGMVHLAKLSNLKQLSLMRASVTASATATARPEALGQPFTRWSLRKLAGYLADNGERVVKVGRERLRQILAANEVTFQRTKTWKESNDPDRDAKLDRIEEVMENWPDRCFAFDEFGPLAIRPTGGAAWARLGRPPPRRGPG